VFEQRFRWIARFGPVSRERTKLIMRADTYDLWQDHLLGEFRVIPHDINNQAISLVWGGACATTEHLDVEARRAGGTRNHQRR
jgi:hypothetical protein